MKLYFLFTFLLLRLSNRDGLVEYPSVHRDEAYFDIYHGTKVPDPYHWLEDLDSEETQQFVKLQNAKTKPYLQECAARSKIQANLEGLMNYSAASVPIKRGNYYFYAESFGLQNQRILYVQETLNGPRRILVNPNNLASDGTTSLSRYYPSKNGELLAYGLSRKGSDWFTTHFKNVSSKLFDDYPDTLANTKFTSLQWTVDSKGVFYARFPHLENEKSSLGVTDDNQKIYYHLVGRPQAEDVLVAEFPENPTWSCYPEISDDGKYLLVNVEQDLGPVRVYYVDVEKFIRDELPELPELHPVITNFESEYGYVTNIETIFIFRTNRKASNYRLVGIDIQNPDEYYWDNNIVPEDSFQVLEWARAVNRDQLLLNYRKNVRNTLQLRYINGGKILKTIPLDIGSIRGESGSKENSEFFFKFESILSPGIIYKIDLSDKNYPVGPPVEPYREARLDSFNSAHYVTKQIFYFSHDGTEIPMFISHKKGIDLGPNTPALLYGYGGFNSPSEPIFDVQNALFMKNFNGVFAIANIRGGGEYGERWYNAGRLMNKQNVFDDFQAAAEFLIARNYTSSPKLTITGNSNGGLLITACINQRPELFGAAIAKVGVTDMLRFHKFTTGLAWTSDYGNSDMATMFPYLLGYSPLHNVRAPKNNLTQYPATLLITGDHDDRVVPSHSFKLIAELQHTIGKVTQQTNPLLIHIETNAGHGAGKPTWKEVQEGTDVFSFICHALGIKFVE